MNDRRPRCPVFCISDIPTTTLNRLLECTEEYLSEFNTPDLTVQVSDRIVVIDSKDITTITRGSSPPIASCPTAFLDHSLREVRDWFDANITQPHTRGYMQYCFLVLDNKSAEDESCIFVCTQDSAHGEIQSLRCEFEVAMENAIACEIQGESIEEGVLGNFMRSGVTMTKENLELVQNGGLYIEDGEVKVDQVWKDFRNW